MNKARDKNKLRLKKLLNPVSGNKTNRTSVCVQSSDEIKEFNIDNKSGERMIPSTELRDKISDLYDCNDMISNLMLVKGKRKNSKITHCNENQIVTKKLKTTSPSNKTKLNIIKDTNKHVLSDAKSFLAVQNGSKEISNNLKVKSPPKRLNVQSNNNEHSSSDNKLINLSDKKNTEENSCMKLENDKGYDGNTEERFCPFCQMPLSEISAHFADWHVSECMEVDLTLSECTNGRLCRSTIESHYRKFTHYALAAERSGINFTTLKTETILSSNLPQFKVNPTSVSTQKSHCETKCSDVKKSNVDIKKTSVSLKLDKQYNFGIPKDSCNESLQEAEIHSMNTSRISSETLVKSAGVCEDIKLDELNFISKDVQSLESLKLGNFSPKTGTQANHSLDTSDCNFELSFHSEIFSDKNKQNNLVKKAFLSDSVHNTLLTSVSPDLNLGHKAIKNSHVNNSVSSHMINCNKEPPLSSPGMKRQATITSFFKLPGKTEAGGRKLSFVDEVSSKEASRNKGKVIKEIKLQRSFSDSSCMQYNSSVPESLPLVSSQYKLSQKNKGFSDNGLSCKKQGSRINNSRQQGRSQQFKPQKVQEANADKAKKSRRSCPFYKKIPNTSFAVDAFSYGAISGVTHYFLSHFHYDHYAGLTRHFKHSVYCSSITANLVSLKLCLPSKYINCLPMNKPCFINGVQVTLLDANHCPGSVMFLFCLPNGHRILHTGDFRATSDMKDFPLLKCGVIHQLYLDTTYCDPAYNFPSQSSVLEYLTSLAIEKVNRNPRILVVCGSYTIGKEKVFLAIAEALNCKIWARIDKQRVLKCLEDDSITSRLVSQERQAQVHVLAMNQVTVKFLQQYLLKLADRFDEVLGLKPTGWTYSSNRITENSLNLIKPVGKSPVTIYGVPYSEHSSYSELQCFVQSLHPHQIIPTVNVSSESSRASMKVIFQKWLAS